MKHVVPKHVNERAVVLLLLVLFQLLHGKFGFVVLSPSYIFLTEVVLTRRFHFFCAVDYTHANDAKVERIESYAALEENCYIWKQYLAEIDKKRKAAEVSHTENGRIYRKAQTKLLVHRV